MWCYNYNDSLCHFGILGQKWGVRRYQNPDGTLTPEGRERYLGNDFDKQIGAVTQATYNVYNRTVDRANRDLSRINKDFNKRYGKDYDFGKDDRANLEYTRSIRDMWQKTYRDVLAEDLGTDPSTVNGQKWLDEMFGYKSNLDTDIENLEKKIKNEDKKKRSAISTADNKSSDNTRTAASVKSKEKYANTKMSQSKAIKTAYADLEKMYPNFNDFSLDKKDELFFDYLNTSGLYKWV